MKDLKVGLQLYSIRDAMIADTEAALKAVKAMGYDYVELAGGRYGRSGAEMRELIRSCGLECISAHQSPSFFLEDREDAVHYLKELGVPFSVIPMSLKREEAYTLRWDETIALYEEMGRAYADAGIRLLYHNHDYELRLPEGQEDCFLDRLYTTVSPELLQPEFDTCWISYGGKNPVDYINRYASRLDVVHLKDYVCRELEQKPIWQLMEEGALAQVPSRKEVGFRYMPVGSGIQDWDAILSAIEASSAEYVVVEQDSSPEPMAAAEESRRFLKERYGY